VVYQDKSKLEFKEIALKWADRPEHFKEFMITEYSSIRSNPNVSLKLTGELSYCALLCKSDILKEKTFRFKTKFKNPPKKAINKQF
jgi:hypothetical protein